MSIFFNLKHNICIIIYYKMSGRKRKPIITLTEKIDKEKLMRLMSSLNITDEEKNAIYKYKLKIYQGNVQVNYYFSDIGFGRLYAEQSLSLQNFRKGIRHALAKDTYIDIDMVNAHPTIIAQLCKKEDIECNLLKDYVKNREVWLKEIRKFHDIDRDEAKKLVLKLCYLGNYELEDSTDEQKLEKLSLFSKELRSISKHIYKLDKTLTDKVESDYSKTNKHASVLSLIAQKIEHNCLMEMRNFLESNGFNVGVLCFDGLMVKKGNKPVTSDLLDKCSEFIKKRTGYLLKLEIKPMDQDIEIPKFNCFVDDDKGAQKNLFKLEDSNYFKYADGKLHIFDEDTGQYSIDKVVLNHYVIKHRNFLLKEEQRTKDITEIKSYGRDAVLMKRIRPFVEEASHDDEWLERTSRSSIGYLLFKDGIYNMKNNTFTKGFNPNIVFHDRVPHNFPERNEEDIKYAADMSFNLLLDDPLPFIVASGRAIAGDISAKKIFFCPGLTNAGKSKLSDMYIICFGGFVKTFDAQNLANMNKNNTNDEASRNRWAYIVRFGRIVFSNEIKMEYPLNGNSIKKFSSGGDRVVGRNHYEGDTAFVPHFTLFCMLNDIPAIDPMDDAVYNRLVYCEFNKQFVEKITNPKNQILADPNFGEKINEPRFIRGFIHLILDGYQYFLDHGQPSFDPIVKESWTVSDKKDRNVSNLLQNHFERSKNDFIYVSNMISFKEKHSTLCSTISRKRFNDIVRFTFEIVQGKVGKDNLCAWIGIKRKDGSGDSLH